MTESEVFLQLLAMKPAVPLPPNSKKRMHNDWSMLDGGDFAVHVMSGTAREKYFSHLM
jgi:ribosomal silencing factor RsfS